MDSAASTVEAKTRKSVSRQWLPWRTIHRIGGSLAVLLMLWMSVTGSTIQLLDLDANLTHRSPPDPTALSIVEGMFGPGNFAVIQANDFNAEAFPVGFDIQRGVDTVLHAANLSATADIAWLDLRMSRGVPVGQVMRGGVLQAFDAQTGNPLDSVAPASIPQGRRLPPSLRQRLKTLHRFWNRDDTPGVYVEFVTGLVLWVFLITGLVMYFQLLKARARIGRRQLFWLAGGNWRATHRAMSVLAALFLICMAASGTWIGFESSYNALGRPNFGPLPPGAAPPGMQSTAPIAVGELLPMTTITLSAMERLHSGTPIKALRLRSYGQMKQGVVITGGATTGQWVFDAHNGQPASLTEPSYPKSGFPLGVQVHENVKHFHSGEMFGLPGQAMNLFAGLSLLFLSISGIVMYLDMWLKRHKSGRLGLIWK